MADTYPFRHKLTGLVQRLTEDAASVFADLLERLPEDFEQKVAEKERADAELAAALEAGSERTKAAREAKAQAEAASAELDSAAEPVPPVAPSDAAQAAALGVPAPISTPAE